MNNKDNIIALMNASREEYKTSETFYKLVALWAVCESFAGGILHAVKMPFTGMILSSLAVLCITLIARFVPGKTQILKATFIVCIFKIMLSPHSPPAAYLAVAFQGLLGQLLFLSGHTTGAAAILGILALIESAVQKILVMIIMYGAPFWKAVNAFLKKNFDPAGSHDYLYTIAVVYICIHALTGLLAGLFASYLARHAEIWKGQYPHLMIGDPEEAEPRQSKSRSRFKILYWTGWLFLLLFYIQAKIDPAHAWLPVSKLTDILLRALIILAGWYLLISPLLMRLIKKILNAGKERMHSEVKAVLELLPGTRHIFIESFRLSASVSGPERIIFFFRILVINVIR
jgi:hypothetical protein